jgi:CBS domain-containing protein
MPVAGITLFIFGGVTSIQGEAEEPGDEFWMAFVGPLTSFALAVIAWLLLGLLRSTVGGRTPTGAVLSYLAYVNLALALFNLIPGFPLDGGRVLRSALWAFLGDLRRATRIASRVGQVVAYLFILGGIFLAFRGEIVNGIWLAFIGWFLLNAADASYRQAAAPPPPPRSVGTAMRAPPAIVPADLSVAELVAEYLLDGGMRAVMVGENGEVVGLVTLSDVQRVAPEQWATTPLRVVMTPAASLAVVGPESSLQEALARLAERDVSQLPVIRNGALVGMLSRADALQLHQPAPGLSPDAGHPGLGQVPPR